MLEQMVVGYENSFSEGAAPDAEDFRARRRRSSSP
jgi:hypothetical protein